MKNKKLLVKILSFVLVLIVIMGTFVIVMPTSASAATQNQQNIVDRANYLWNCTWVCQKTVKGWNNAYTFVKGETYRLPYGQPIYSGKYIGYNVSIEDFLKSTKSASSVFYSSRSSYQKSSTYYATDCSAFVAWCWGTSRQTTYSIPNISKCIGKVTTSNATNKLQLGDCLNSSPHVVLVTNLKYDSNGAITEIEITEQTPPQLKKTIHTPASLAAKYGASYKIYRYTKNVPAAPEGYTYAGTDFSTQQTLLLGSKGLQVEHLQKALNVLGYGKLSVDGSMGEGTVGAVKSYQKDNGLTVDGKAGPNTLTSMKNKVTAIQKNLKTLKYYSGSIDGIFGTGSITALKNFQKDNGISATGVANAATLNAINNALTGSNTPSKDTTTETKPTVTETKAPETEAPKVEETAKPETNNNVSYTVNSKLKTNQTLKNGSSGTQVEYVQKALKVFGYLDGAVDGKYGNGTAAAVKAYQKDNGLTADGIAGSKTLTHLVNKATDLQIKLKKLGYYNGAIDAALGDGTVSAIKSFQKAKNLTVDGIAGSKTLTALKKAVG